VKKLEENQKAADLKKIEGNYFFIEAHRE